MSVLHWTNISDPMHSFAVRGTRILGENAPPEVKFDLLERIGPNSEFESVVVVPTKPKNSVIMR